MNGLLRAKGNVLWQSIGAGVILRQRNLRMMVRIRGLSKAQSSRVAPQDKDFSILSQHTFSLLG